MRKRHLPANAALELAPPFEDDSNGTGAEWNSTQKENTGGKCSNLSSERTGYSKFEDEDDSEPSETDYWKMLWKRN